MGLQTEFTIPVNGAKFVYSRNSCSHFPRMAIVRMIVMLNDLCWMVTRISIAEKIAVERQEYVHLQMVMDMYGVDKSKEDREAFKRPASQQREGNCSR